MATITLAPGLTDIRQSIGGSTYSKNAGGNYIRAHVKPINKGSVDTTARKGAIALVHAYWRGTLNQPQREAWRTYVNATGWTNKLGQKIVMSGHGAFFRTNLLRVMIQDSIIVKAPSLPGHAASVTLTWTATAATQRINISATSGTWDRTTPDDWLIIYQYAPSNPGRIALPRHYRLWRAFEGNEISPPPIPVSKSSDFPFQEHAQMSLAMIHLDPIGRVSSRITTTQPALA